MSSKRRRVITDRHVPDLPPAASDRLNNLFREPPLALPAKTPESVPVTETNSGASTLVCGPLRQVDVVGNVGASLAFELSRTAAKPRRAHLWTSLLCAVPSFGSEGLRQQLWERATRLIPFLDGSFDPSPITRDFATKSSAVVFARVRAPHELKFHRSPPCAEPKCMFTLPPPPILPNYLNSHPPKSRHKGTVGETGRLPRRAASASSRADDEASAVRVVALRGLRSQVREACCCGCMATRTGAGSYRR
jgi:hypothetical protein